MPNLPSSRCWGILLLAVCLTVPIGGLNAAPAQAAATTRTKEARRIAAVKTPTITWVEDSDSGGYTGSVRLPLDYDKPGGSKVTIALFKVPAADPDARIGTLFVNPGGPGGSGVELAEQATEFLSQNILNRFDIVGFDPRGTNSSTQLTCFSSSSVQTTALNGMGDSFPTADDQDEFVTSATKLGKACSNYGVKLASSMSTAEVARDLEVLRKAVGDKKLNYLGFSYGSYLGQVYANMFPDRFRAIAIDGVLNPVEWAGTSITSSIPTTTRIQAGEASWAALVAGLAACADAGADYCPLDDPQADFEAVAQALKAETLQIGDGADVWEYSYTDFISDSLTLLYYPEGMDYLAQLVAALEDLLATEEETTETDLDGAGDQVNTLVRSFRSSVSVESFDVGYDNDLEAYSGILCTDSYRPDDTDDWVSIIAKSDAVTPHFSEIWGWADVQCATDSWTATDEDAYHGGYSRNTAAPILVVGNYYDPATSYEGAVEASVLMPNSVLLRSASWGHTAYGTSDCVTDRIDSYLITGTIPDDASTTVCTGDVTPFTTYLGSGSEYSTSSARVEVPTRVGLPPVEIPWLSRED